MDKDEIEATAKQVGGQVKSAVADAVGDTQSSLSGRIREIRGDAQVGFGQVKDQVGEAAARAAEYAHEVYDHRQQHLERGRRVVAESFNQNPLLTVAIAGVAGLFLGFLIGRESR